MYSSRSSDPRKVFKIVDADGQNGVITIPFQGKTLCLQDIVKHLPNSSTSAPKTLYFIGPKKVSNFSKMDKMEQYKILSRAKFSFDLSSYSIHDGCKEIRQFGEEGRSIMESPYDVMFFLLQETSNFPIFEFKKTIILVEGEWPYKRKRFVNVGEVLLVGKIIDEFGFGDKHPEDYTLYYFGPKTVPDFSFLSEEEKIKVLFPATEYDLPRADDEKERRRWIQSSSGESIMFAPYQVLFFVIAKALPILADDPNPMSMYTYE